MFHRRLRESFAKKPSTAFSHDAEVGVEWKVNPYGRFDLDMNARMALA